VVECKPLKSGIVLGGGLEPVLWCFPEEFSIRVEICGSERSWNAEIVTHILACWQNDIPGVQVAKKQRLFTGT
jgi:hypothetical protein